MSAQNQKSVALLGTMLALGMGSMSPPRRMDDTPTVEKADHSQLRRRRRKKRKASRRRRS